MGKAIVLSLLWFTAGFLVNTYYFAQNKLELQELSKGYSQMFGMCEQKYQAAIRGDINTATMLKEDIASTQANIKKLLK